MSFLFLGKKDDRGHLAVKHVEWAVIGGLLTLLAVGMAVPGPSNSTCAAHASVHGRRSNIPLIIGLGVGFFSVNVICGLAVNSFEPESFVGKTLHYLGSFLMILLAVLLIFVARSKRTINIAETIPRLGFKTGFGMQIVNTKQWMVIFSLMSFFLVEFESYPGGIPGGVVGTLTIATINTTSGFLAMAVWTNVGHHVQHRLSDPKFARIVILGLGILLLIMSILILLRYHFAN